MCKMIQFTEEFCFQVVTSKNFFDLGLDVRWFWGVSGNLPIRFVSYKMIDVFSMIVLPLFDYVTNS